MALGLWVSCFDRVGVLPRRDRTRSRVMVRERLIFFLFRVENVIVEIVKVDGERRSLIGELYSDFKKISLLQTLEIFRYPTFDKYKIWAYVGS